MASTVSPTGSVSRADADTAPAPAFRDEAGSSADTGSLPKPHPVSQASSSELVPGAFPRDPRVALDRLNDKAEDPTDPQGGTLYEAAREDVRRVVDFAAGYLPGSVVGAFGSVLPAGTINTDEADNKLDPGHASHEGQTATRFDPKNIAVAGIASDFDPSASKSRDSAAEESWESRHTDTSVNPDDEQSPFEDYAHASSAMDAASSDGAFESAPPSDKASKDFVGADDAQKASDVEPKGNQKKNALEAAGLGAMGGAAYQHSKASTQASGKTGSQSNDPSAQATTPDGSGTRDVSSTDDKDRTEQPPFATYAPAPIITDTIDTSAASAKPPAKSTFESQDTPRGQSLNTSQSSPSNTTAQRPDDSSTEKDRKKKAIEATALGAGIGTLGGATYEHSRAPEEVPSTTSTSQNQDPTNVRAPPTSAVRESGGTEGREASGGPQSSSKPKQRVWDSDGTPTGKSAVSDPSTDSRTKKATEAGALGAGLGAVGGAAYEHSRSPNQGQFSDAVHADDPSNKSTHGALPAASTADDKDRMQSRYKDAVVAPDTAATSGVDKDEEKEKQRREQEAEREQQKREKEAEKEQKEQQKREKEAEKRAKETKRHEEEAAAAALAADKKAQKEREKEEKHQKQQQKEAEKEQHRKEKEAKEREKESKRHEKEAAAAALASDKRAKEPQSEAKQLEDESGDKDGQELQEDGKSKAKDPAEATAAALAAASAERAGKNRSIDEPTGSSTQEPTTASKEADFAHPSDKSASAHHARPGPIAYTGGSKDRAKSGADSDFPLPSANASASRIQAVDIDGKGNGAGAGTGTDNGTGTGIGRSASHEPAQREKSKHGSEGLQEKHEGGGLPSSTIDRNKDEEGAGSKHGDDDDSAKSNGKREGGFKHFVGKVKDKLHHHEK